jgi:hypothetical protein
MLFVHFALVADDLGNAEAGDHFIRRRLLSSNLPDAAIAKLLTELHDADLARAYTSADGKRYVHIPRFRQRVRFLRGKHPRPPREVECNEIKELIAEKTDSSLTNVGLKPGSRRAQDGLKTPEVKRSEVKKIKSKDTRARTRPVETPIPENFSISDGVRKWAAEKGHDRLDQRLEHFAGIAKARGYVYADWDAAFMNAIRDNWAKLPDLSVVPKLSL